MYTSLEPLMSHSTRSTAELLPRWSTRAQPHRASIEVREKKAHAHARRVRGAEPGLGRVLRQRARVCCAVHATQRLLYKRGARGVDAGGAHGPLRVP
eukprot:7379904-Prymnesium_polylepis.1